VLLKSQVFWDMVLNYLVNISQCFEMIMVQYHQVQAVRAVQEDCFDCLNPEDEGTAVLQSMGNYSPSIT